MPNRDTQVVELIGRNRLVSELLRAGIEVAVPVRDRGIDVIAYSDLYTDVKRFAARPIQMKAASHSSFSISKKYERVANLIIVRIPMKVISDSDLIPVTCSEVKAVVFGAKRRWRSYRA